MRRFVKRAGLDIWQGEIAAWGRITDHGLLISIGSAIALAIIGIHA